MIREGWSLLAILTKSNRRIDRNNERPHAPSGVTVPEEFLAKEREEPQRAAQHLCKGGTIGGAARFRRKDNRCGMFLKTMITPDRGARAISGSAYALRLADALNYFTAY